MLTAKDSLLFVSLLDLQVICNISKQRGKELLEATNGSLERAVDLHLHQSNAAAKQGRLAHHLGQSNSTLPEIESDVGKSKKRLNSDCSASSSKKRAKDMLPEDCKKSDKAKIISSPPKEKELLSTSKLKSEDSSNLTKACSEISFGRLSKTLQAISDTTKRTIKLQVLKEFISAYAQGANEADEAVSLTCGLKILLGNVVEESIGVSGRTVSSALQDSLGVSSKQLSMGYRQHGDLGDSAAGFFQPKRYFVTSKSRSLSVVEVHQSFEKISVAEGNNAKKDIVSKLLRSCQCKNELRFMVRLLIGNMRIGCNIKTVLAAIAMAFQSPSSDANLTEKAAIELVQKTHDLCPDLEKILRALLLGGFEKMESDCTLHLFTPIMPMLANPTHSLAQVDQAMTKMHNSVVLEWKYDGVRCQAHFDGNSARLYSRHMLQTTTQYPDAIRYILEARNRSKEVYSFIIDAEIVGVEGIGKNSRLLPFQELATRKKKDDGTGVKIKVFTFDIMYLNGKSYVNEPLWRRRDLLREYFNETSNFAFVTSKVLPTFDEQAIQEYLAESMEQGTEGLMVKMLGKNLAVSNDDEGSSRKENSVLQSTYEAGTRSQSWLKVKRDYVEGFADTIDVVPIGAWHGTGRKAEKDFLSPVLLAVYDEDEDVYRSICRCMTFTDAMYTAMREFYLNGIPYPQELSSLESDCQTKGSENSEKEKGCLQEVSVSEDTFCGGFSEQEVCNSEAGNCFVNRPTSAFVVTNEQPPIWFKPLEVFEVSFADMSLSRQHTAAAGLIPDPGERGVALRFPRFKRRRPDKQPDQATTSAQIAAMFLNQSKQMKSSSR